MHAKFTFIKKLISWENPNLSSLLCYYRYCSLLITSILYLIGPPASPLYLKLGVSFSLLVEAYIFTKIYNGENEESDRNKKILILVETVGLAFILILTGGIQSPFFWYALNPILLSATLFPVYFCWAIMGIFITAAISLERFSLYHPGDAIQLWPEKASPVFIFALVTLVAQLYSYSIHKLSRQSEIMQKQLEHIKSLYEAVEVFSYNNNPQEIVSLFASYAKTLTGAKKVIVWIEAEVGLKERRKKNYYAIRGPRQVLAEEIWYPYLKQVLADIDKSRGVRKHYFTGKRGNERGMLLTVKVCSKTNSYGVLSAYYEDPGEADEAAQTLTFLAELCAVALEKHSMEAIAEDFLLVDEKNRIAGEIHDSVNQNLFGVVYSLDTLIKDRVLSEPLRKQLRLLQKTLQRSLKELRTAIYSMSTLKNKAEPFVEEVEKYLYDLAQLNDISVNYETLGCFNLSSQVRNSLYRIIREATGNAIRHGSCSNIKVRLEADRSALKLTITDNGCGFTFAAIEREEKNGLGLINMQELSRNIGGTLEIESIPGRGTKVFCKIPLGQEHGNLFKEEEMIG
ncbi:MAG: sensor histidine kinase [Dethiobacteria bacterium]